MTSILVQEDIAKRQEHLTRLAKGIHLDKLEDLKAKIQELEKGLEALEKGKVKTVILR